MNREAARQLMLHVGNLLDFLQVPSFLMQGTALGAYRDKGFVPSEKDIDLGVLQEDMTSYTALCIVSSLTRNGFDVELFTQPFPFVRTIVVWGNDCKLDLVGWSKHKGKRFTATPVRSWIDKPYAIVHEASLLETYKQIELFGKSWKIPSDIEKYLTLEYGPDWRTPKDDHVSRTRVYNFLAKEGIV